MELVDFGKGRNKMERKVRTERELREKRRNEGSVMLFFFSSHVCLVTSISEIPSHYPNGQSQPMWPIKPKQTQSRSYLQTQTTNTLFHNFSVVHKSIKLTQTVLNKYHRRYKQGSQKVLDLHHKRYKNRAHVDSKP